MKAIDRRFVEIIEGTKQFIIPVFQRDYSWTREQCRQLWTDIVRTPKGSADGHFLGSLVYTGGTSGAVFSSWLVIDGQQRLTTLTLLLTALRDHIRKTGWAGEEATAERIDENYLRNKHERDERSYKLVLRRHDQESLRALLDRRDPSELASVSELVVDAYDFFREELESAASDPDTVFRGIGGLKMVDVSLHPDTDNPQLVFESLNSTGVDLTQSDLIRNYLLMGLQEQDQTRLYNDYWSKLEALFRESGSAFDSFLRDYLALKQQTPTQVRTDRIYAEFKDFWRPPNSEPLPALLDDMVRLAGYYASFLKPERIASKPLASAMRHVHFGSTHSAHALLIVRLYECYDRRALTEEDFIRALNFIASYLVRRAVLGLQTRGYWSIFARIAHSIDEESTFESFQVSLARQNYSFPSDESFMRELQDRDLYSLRICWHILTQLENFGQNEPSPTQEYSIEHIMPVSIEEVVEWQEMLGDSWRSVHQEWLHRLGNLTFTAYNSTYNNRPFEDKKAIEGGFNQSAVRLNEYVRNQAQWTENEMEERGRILASRALEIWPHHRADERAILKDELRELRVRANELSAASLEMRDHVREVLHTMQGAMRELGDVIEVVENRSICYYDGAARFFAEALPMANHVRLLLPLEFSEVDDPGGLAANAKEWRFFVNVTHGECGVLIDVWGEEQVSAAMPMVRQAFSSGD